MDLVSKGNSQYALVRSDKERVLLQAVEEVMRRL